MLQILKRETNSTLWVQEETEKNPDTICPMQQSHPSDEPDQGTKGTEGPDAHANFFGYLLCKRAAMNVIFERSKLSFHLKPNMENGHGVLEVTDRP